MTWNVERDPAQGWLMLTYRGPLTRQDCVRSTRQALEQIDTCAPQGFVVDMREAVCELRVGDIYTIPALWEHADVHRGSALAMIVDAAIANGRDSEFFENTCRNRGWNVCVFDDRAAACGWLAQQLRAADSASA